MPTVLRSGPYSFHFYAGDRSEPPHVHVTRDSNEAKFWLGAVSYQSNKGFRKRELKRIERLVLENREYLLGEWDDFFSK